VNRRWATELQLAVTGESSSPLFTWHRHHHVFPTWQRDYEAVWSATDEAALIKNIEVAEAAMLTRRDALSSSAENRAEWQSLEVGLADLHVFKKERLHR
jgi:hypothetical protein